MKFGYLFPALLLFCVVTIQAQDRIITVQNDTIHCRIISISEGRIYYEQPGDNSVMIGKSLPADQVSTYFRNTGSSMKYAQDVKQTLAIPQERWQSTDSAAIRYLRNISWKATLFHGNMQDKQPWATNHPYMQDDRYTKARLSYRGVVYPDALLRLDLSRNELMTVLPGYRNIILFPENVDYAELHGKHIIYFCRDSLPNCPSTGYYILLHSGECKILEKQTASLKFDSSSGESYYTFKTSFYLYKNGVYYTIRNKRGLLKILSLYKKELKRFISDNHLRFRKNAEDFLSRTVGEYEKITGSL